MYFSCSSRLRAETGGSSKQEIFPCFQQKYGMMSRFRQDAARCIATMPFFV